MLKVAAIFSNNCVLQREKNIDIFGEGAEGKIVEVYLFNNSKKLIAANESVIFNGKWKVTLPPQYAMTECSMMVRCGKEIRDFENIAIGEVWLCGGQSNMEFELQNCTEGPSELESEDDPNVRFYYTNKISWIDDAFYKAERRTRWQTWKSPSKKAWSAVGFFFAKKLASELGVTVGLIGCNWGGTSASAWIDKSYLEKDKDLKTYLKEQDDGTKGKSIEQQCKEWDAYLARDAEWNKKAQEVFKVQPDIDWNVLQEKIGKNEFPGPKSCKSPYRPCGLYETMLKRVMPYTMQGVLWYQGESDDYKPNSYAKLFSNMIDNWRTEWKDDTLPFIFVQLPGNRYKQDKDFKHWCLIREQQEKVSKTIANTYMACALDLGDYNDIHPKGKKVIAERMEKIAMKEIYKARITGENAFSPVFKSALPRAKEIVLIFENAANGFVVKPDEKRLEELKQMEEWQGNLTVNAMFSPDEFSKLSTLEQSMTQSGWTGFEVAGQDGKFFPAIPCFEKNKITLSSPKVIAPVAARYAWFNYCPVTVYNKEGLPLAPFRTDRI